MRSDHLSKHIRTHSNNRQPAETQSEELMKEGKVLNYTICIVFSICLKKKEKIKSSLKNVIAS